MPALRGIWSRLGRNDEQPHAGDRSVVEGDDRDDTASIRTVLPAYDAQTVRPSSPAPTYRTVETIRPGRPSSPAPSYVTYDVRSPEQSTVNSGTNKKSSAAENEALFTAVTNGQLGAVDKLLEQGAADANAKTPQGEATLHLAVKSRNEEMVQMLLARGANINAIDRSSQTPIYTAVSDHHPHLGIIDLFLRSGADLSPPDNLPSWSPLNIAAHGGKTAVVKLFLERGASVAPVGTTEVSPLIAAVYASQLEVVRLLLKRGEDPKAKESKYWTALGTAARMGHVEIFRLILDETGASIDSPTTGGWTPLIVATRCGKLEIVKLCLNRGAVLEPPGHISKVALHTAAEYGETRIVELLLNRGANPNVKAGNQTTPMHLAVQRRHWPAVEELIYRGASPKVVDSYGRTPIDYCPTDAVDCFRPKLQRAYSSTPKTRPDQQRTVLRKSVRRFTKELLKRNPEERIIFLSYLARCLIFLGDMESAKSAWEYSAKYSQRLSTFVFNTICDTCNQAISDVCCACKECPLVVLCGKCFKKYNSGALLKHCENHDFLRVPVPVQKLVATKSGTGRNVPAMKDWLKQLRSSY